jgi:hypothetical protein
MARTSDSYTSAGSELGAADTPFSGTVVMAISRAWAGQPVAPGCPWRR